MAEYIDREAFLSRELELYCKDCDRRKGMKNGKNKVLYRIGEAPCRSCFADDVLTDLEEFPTADVAQVKHGVWETDEDGCMCCSLCGNPAEINGITGEFMESPYCSECGAKMDGETDG